MEPGLREGPQWFCSGRMTPRIVQLDRSHVLPAFEVFSSTLVVLDMFLRHSPHIPPMLLFPERSVMMAMNRLSCFILQTLGSELFP